MTDAYTQNQHNRFNPASRPRSFGAAPPASTRPALAPKGVLFFHNRDQRQSERRDALEGLSADIERAKAAGPDAAPLPSAV